MELTNEMRDFLSDPLKRKWTTWNVTLCFINDFELKPEEAGKLLSDWAKECFDTLTVPS